jgi:hypothetical protein
MKISKITLNPAAAKQPLLFLQNKRILVFRKSSTFSWGFLIFFFKNCHGSIKFYGHLKTDFINH